MNQCQQNEKKIYNEKDFDFGDILVDLNHQNEKENYYMNFLEHKQ